MKKNRNNQIDLQKWPKKAISQKTNDLLSKFEKSVRDAIAATWIAISTLVPSVESLTVAPTIAKITIPTAAAIMTACEREDLTPPTIDAKSSIDISWWEQVRISGNQLYIWNNMVASWHDDVSATCTAYVTLKWNNIVWKPLNESCTVNLKVTDEAGNPANASINVNMLNNAPIITAKSSVNIFWWEKISISNNQLFLWDEEIASRSDDKTQNCTVLVKFNGKEVKSWDTINPTGKNDKISITVTDDKGKYDSKEINVTNDTILWLESLKNLNIQVDQEVDLLKWISMADWAELIKVEIGIDGKRYELSDPHHYTPEYPWTCNIIFTVKWKSWNTIEVKSDSLTIKALEYNPITPQEANIYENRNEWKKNVEWDKERYKFFETVWHLQIRKIVEELIKNGWPEYLEKLNNIQIIWLSEQPNDNCPYIQWTREVDNPDQYKKWQHAEILNEKIKTSTSTPGIAQNYPWKILRFSVGNRSKILEYVNNHPNQKFIFFCANDWLGWVWEQYNPKNTDEWKALTSVINSQRCIAIVSVWNVDALRDYALRWDQEYISRWQYGSSGAIWPNIIGALWWTTEAVTLNDYDYNSYAHSVKPIWYNQRNLKISSWWYPAHESATSFASQSNRASSRPAGELAGELRNIAALDPDMNMSDVMNTINSYSISIPATHNGQTIENFNTPDQKEICRQIRLPSAPSQLSSKQRTELPKDKYLPTLRIWKWAEYQDSDWQRKPAQGISDPSEIYRIAKNCKTYFNPELFKKQWWKDTAELTVLTITSEWTSIPEVVKKVSIKVK